MGVQERPSGAEVSGIDDLFELSRPSISANWIFAVGWRTSLGQPELSSAATSQIKPSRSGTLSWEPTTALLPPTSTPCR